MNKGLSGTSFNPLCRLLFAAIFILMLFPFFFLIFSFHVRAADTPEVTALSAVVMDRQSRRVLWEKDAQKILPMASITKIMTAILALEYGCEDDIVVVSARAAATEGSSIWLEKGERKTLRELLYGLMMQSGNDAAVSIAEHLAGSVEDFAVMMNEKAVELGAANTRFANPHGLCDENHYSTAYDFALIASYALENERFREIITTTLYTISWPGEKWDRVISNQNRLLEIYPGGDGVKSGWTDKAGRCFVGSATRDGWQLVMVVLNAPQMWDDSVILLDHGFEKFNNVKLLEQGQVVRSVPIDKGGNNLELAAASDFYYPLGAGEESLIRYRFELNDKISAPLASGVEVGELNIFLDNFRIGTVSLNSGSPVARKPVGHYMLMLLRAFCR